MSFTTRQSVLQCLKDRESRRWEEFYHLYVPLIRMHGRDCGLKNEYIDDLVQNVMLSLCSSGARFRYDPDKGRFRDFLRRVIRVRTMDILREHYNAEKRQSRAAGIIYGDGTLTLPDTRENAAGETALRDAGMLPDVETSMLSPDEELDSRFSEEWRRQLVPMAMQALKLTSPAQHYQIFCLTYFRRCSALRVATYFAMPLSSVYSIRCRLEKKLKKVIRDIMRGSPDIFN